jgi:RNA polymerase sigma factor (sigma-70 family)
MERTRHAGECEPEAEKDRANGWAALYRDHAPWLARRVAASRPPPGLEAEDVVQEAYLRATRYPTDQVGRHPRALLLTIAVNVIRDFARKGRLPLEPANDRGEDRALAQLPDQEYALELKQIIVALPDDLRDVFVLSRFTPMTYVQIARHLGLTEKAVEWRLSKALALCAKRLRDE